MQTTFFVQLVVQMVFDEYVWDYETHAGEDGVNQGTSQGLVVFWEIKIIVIDILEKKQRATRIFRLYRKL